MRTHIFTFLCLLLRKFTLTSSATFSFYNSASINIRDTVYGIYRSIKDDFRYRKSSLEQYRDQLTFKLKTSFDQFKSEQLKLSNYALNDFENYLTQFKLRYNDTVSLLQSQKNAITELQKFKLTRPSQIDESLDKFRAFYDENIIQVEKQMKQFPTFHLEDALKQQKQASPKLPSFADFKKSSVKLRKFYKIKQPISFKVPTQLVTKSKEFTPQVLFNELDKYFQVNKRSFSKQFDQLSQNLQNQWRKIILDPHLKSLITEESIHSFMREFNYIQKDIISKADSILKESQGTIKMGLNKKELKLELTELNIKLRNLEETTQLWIEDKRVYLDNQLKVLQDKLNNTNKLYEELVKKKKSELEYSNMNDQTLHMVLGLIDPKDKGWKFISKSSDGDINVYRRFLPGPKSQYACVMANGTINSPPAKVLALLEDTNRIKEYNSFFEEGKDVAIVADDTRVMWCATPPIFPVKARDFVTVIHVRKLKDGTCVVLNRAVDHQAAPKTANYVRGNIVLGAHIIQPIPSHPHKCRLTMLTQLDPGGFAPAPLINHLCSMGPIGFMQNVEIAAKKT